MAKKDRTGNRVPREQRKRYKVPELGYYLIVTDTDSTAEAGAVQKRRKNNSIRDVSVYDGA